MSSEGALIREGKALGLLIVPEYMWEITDFEVQLDKTLNAFLWLHSLPCLEQEAKPET